MNARYWGWSKTFVFVAHVTHVITHEN
jgi:hypothetical protein